MSNTGPFPDQKPTQPQESPPAAAAPQAANQQVPNPADQQSGQQRRGWTYIPLQRNATPEQIDAFLAKIKEMGEAAMKRREELLAQGQATQTSTQLPTPSTDTPTS